MVLEITESQLMKNTELISKTLLKLSDYGVKIAIDDFGTGFSSLSYLGNFRVHALKIDRSFISQLNGNERYLAIARAIISLGSNLGLDVIAEGVETEVQLNFLLENQCPHAQGYYFAGPLEAEKVARFIEQMSER